MPEEYPPITVIVPTRSRPQLVIRAVDGVLRQNYPGYVECVVVSDGEEPPNLPPATHPRRRIVLAINRRTPGPAGARNTGIDLAAHSILAFCDDDDEWLPDKLSRQVPLLGTSPAATIVGCGIWVAEGDGRRTKRTPPAVLHVEDFYRGRHMEVNPSTMLLRRGDFAQPVYDEGIPGSRGEDYDLVLRASSTTAVRNVTDQLVIIHRHASEAFTGRPTGFCSAHEYLLLKHVGLRESRRGRSRVGSLIALGYAYEGNRRQARTWAVRSLTSGYPTCRAVVALGASFGVIDLRRAQRAAVRLGRSLL